MKNQKGIAPIIIVLAVIILLVGGILAWQYFETPNEKVETPKEEVRILEYRKKNQQLSINERLPHFEDFPILEKFEGTPALVDLLSHPEAPRYRTALTEGMKKGPNFAGHYRIIEIGCSTGCQSYFIVNTKTGVVYSAPFSTARGAEFRIDSNLFIADPFCEESREIFYKFKNRFRDKFGDRDLDVLFEKHHSYGDGYFDDLFEYYGAVALVRPVYYKWENNQFVKLFEMYDN